MEKLASVMTEYLLGEEIIDDEDRDVYHYCIEVTLSFVVYWGLILSCAVAVGRLWESIVYVLAFMAMRHNVGGYHAASHLRCAILSMITYLVFLGLIFYLPSKYISLFCIIVSALGGMLVLALAPVEHPNKPFSIQEWKRYRKGSLVVTSGLILVICFSLRMGLEILALCLSFALFQAAVSLLASKEKDHTL